MRDLRTVGAQQLFTGGILSHSLSLVRGAFSFLLHYLLSIFPDPVFSSVFFFFFTSQHHLSVLCLLNRFAHSRRPLPQLHPWHFPFSLQNRRMICKTESIRGEFLDVCQTMLEQQHELFCAQISTVYTLLALVRDGSRGRGRETRRKYPINLQDISCEAPVHTANDVTLCACMSKCHNKLLHISQCFYLMMALCVGCVISSLRFCCCGGGSLVMKSVEGGGEGIGKQNCVQGCNCAGFIIYAEDNVQILKPGDPSQRFPNCTHTTPLK